jgi:hypothetical protein
MCGTLDSIAVLICVVRVVEVVLVVVRMLVDYCDVSHVEAAVASLK